jgi:hypothetical protein
MFRYLCFMLIMVLSLGNIIRLGKPDQTDFPFWLTLLVLLFTGTVIVRDTLKALRALQKPKRIRLSDLKKYDDLW